MYPVRARTNRRDGGQALVIMVVAMIAALAMVALIVDGGNAWAQQRITQNGTDAAANAGATVLARRLAGEAAVASGPAADAAAKVAVDAIVAANGIALTGAYYTDICGVMLRPNGTRANNVGEAALVGAGALPTDIGQTPDCPSGQTGPVAGVRAIGNKPFSTFIAPLIGLTDMTAGADATAVTGYLQGLCEPENDEACVVLPVTFPTTVVTCDNQGDAENTDIPWTPPKGVRVIVPLCKNGPGNVGWLDWTPPGGGASELADAIIPPPYNDPIDLPSWQYVDQTGNINSKPVEDALNYWAGQVVYIPMFDLTCNADPNDAYVRDPQSPPGGPYTGQYGCLNGNIGGKGQNQWYRIPQVAAFELERAYVQGNNSAQCTTSASPSSSCLIGKFVDVISTGTVGAGGSGGTGETSVIGVQLIK